MSHASPQTLKRDIGLGGAILLGLGSIVGTGVFVSIGIAAGVVGPAVVLATALAGCLAACNALSSAQLAAAHPVAGGTYEYGYRLLNPTLGFSAGWYFLCAKSASAGTAAAAAAIYILQALGIEHPVARPALAIALGLGITALVIAGIRRSNQANTAIVGITLASLLILVVVAIPTARERAAENFTNFIQPNVNMDLIGMPICLLQAVALMFVAYTGYGRIATLGEEVHEPRRTIPRAIIATLGVTTVLYITVAFIGVAVLSAWGLWDSVLRGRGPLHDVAAAVAGPWLGWVIGLGAVTAMLGVLLNLILGLSRVVLAMGRRGDLPARFAQLNAAGTSPTAAVLLVGIVVTGIAAWGDLRLAWTFSAFTVLIYYGLTNLCALRLPPEHRLYPRVFAVIGLLGCFLLAWFVPWQVWLVGLGILALGHILRRLLRPPTAA